MECVPNVSTTDNSDCIAPLPEAGWKLGAAWCGGLVIDSCFAHRSHLMQKPCFNNFDDANSPLRKFPKTPTNYGFESIVIAVKDSANDSEV
jgi:hypothetical protein